MNYTPLSVLPRPFKRISSSHRKARQYFLIFVFIISTLTGHRKKRQKKIQVLFSQPQRSVAELELDLRSSVSKAAMWAVGGPLSSPRGAPGSLCISTAGSAQGITLVMRVGSLSGPVYSGVGMTLLSFLKLLK